LRPSMADAGFGRRGSRRVRDPLDEDLTRMFEQRTRVQPLPGWASSAATREYETRTDDRTGPNPLNDRLREMRDTRADDNEYDARQGGVERLYHPDDL
jgi:hypothetical protein